LARYDKYDPKAGGFRAPLGFNAVAGDLGVPWAVGVDANGRVVKGGTPIKGVLVITKVKSIGDIVDVMTAGEIVEAGGGAAGTTALATLGGIVWGAAATGQLSQTGGAGTKPLGFTVDGNTVPTTRLIVRVDPTRVNDAA
jgi:hypothetical protein